MELNVYNTPPMQNCYFAIFGKELSKVVFCAIFGQVANKLQNFCEALCEVLSHPVKYSTNGQVLQDHVRSCSTWKSIF